MMFKQRGASGIFIAVILLLVAVGILAVLALRGGSAGVERGTQVAGSFKVLETALQQYVTANGSLPCPADPALDTGDANPAAASAVCNTPQGTVPWKAIGVRREDAIDAWGGKISYRVFSGNTGFTQANGAGMVNCDTVEPSPSGPDASGLCKTTQNTTEAQFLAGKGLTVNAFGVMVSDVAYVLISHGPTGLGAYTTAGQQKAMPASAAEIANTSAAGPFVAQAASAQGVAPGDAMHFDDSVAYAGVGELIRRAGMGGRNWPDTALKFDAPSVSAALGGAAVSPGPLGTTTLNFGGFAQVTGADLGGASELSFDDTGTYSGIGVAGGGSNLIQSSANESLVIDFASRATQFGATLANFGAYGFFYVELVRFDFYLDGTGITSTFGLGCNADGGLASFFADVGTEFNRVVIVPVPSINFFPPPGSGITAFLVSEVASCPASASSCRTSLDAPANRCS